MSCLLFQRMLAIIGLAVIVGAADSWWRPTRITLLDTAVPAKQAPTAPADSRQVSAESESKKQPESTAAPATSPAPTTTPVEVPAAAMGLMIDARQAKTLFDQGVVFLDARIESLFKAGHVKDAYHLNTAMFSTPAAAETMKALDQSQPIVIYCDGGDCDASTNLAILLQGAGYTKLHIIKDGFPDWEKQGYPIEKPKP